MSVLKVIVIVAIAGIFLFAVALYFALSPTIRDVSDHTALKPLLNKKLTVKRSSAVYYCEGAEYRFIQNVLLENREQYPWKKTHEVKPGTSMTVLKFKTYKNATSGFTHLYALARLQLASDEKIDVEYD